MDPMIVMLWMKTAYASKNLSMPDDFDVAYGTCIHWMLRSEISRLEEWAEHMGMNPDPDAEILDFKVPEMQAIPAIPVSFSTPEAEQTFRKLAGIK